MKPANHFQPPRSSIVFHHTRRMLDQTALCMRKFAMRVAEQYMGLIAPDLRQVPFRWGVTGDDLFKAERHNAQQISRYMDGTVKVMPADLEDAWLFALPEPYRSECERDLAHRRGLVAWRLVQDRDGQFSSMGKMMVEFGQLIEAAAPAFADGQLNQADKPYAQRIVNEADDAIAAIMCVRQQAEAMLGEGTPGQLRTGKVSG